MSAPPVSPSAGRPHAASAGSSATTAKVCPCGGVELCITVLIAWIWGWGAIISALACGFI